MTAIATYNGFVSAARLKVYAWLKGEWAAGRRKRPVRRDVCGQTVGYLMAHSEDYSAPYGDHIGQWSLCYWCHMLLHCRFRAPDRFAEYARTVMAGHRFANPSRAQWGAVQSYLSGRGNPALELTGRALTTNPFQPLLDQGADVRRRLCTKPGVIADGLPSA